MTTGLDNVRQPNFTFDNTGSSTDTNDRRPDGIFHNIGSSTVTSPVPDEPADHTDFEHHELRQQQPLRRSTRTRRIPRYLHDYVL